MRSLVLFAAVFLFSAANAGLPAGTVEKVRKAVVEVHIAGRLRGAGAIVRDPDGKAHILTAAHLLPNPRVTCMVRTHDDEAHFASLSAYDLGHDLALLEIDPDLSSRYGALPIASGIPTDTADVYNFGPALYRRILVLSGSVADRRISYTDFSESGGYLAHFFVSGINPALTSGGVWVDGRGAVVGIQNGRLNGDEGAPSSGLSLVSPTPAISALLRDRESTRTPDVGGYLWELWTADESLVTELPRGTDGLVANAVFEGRPLAKAGIKRFDVIVACDGKPIVRRNTFLDLIRSKPPGTTFRLQVISPGAAASRETELTTECLEDRWR